jgi:hypothetical protein
MILLIKRRTTFSHQYAHITRVHLSISISLLQKKIRSLVYCYLGCFCLFFVSFRAVMELGCVCHVRPEARNRDMSHPFTLKELEMKSDSREKYLINKPKYCVSIYCLLL